MCGWWQWVCSLVEAPSHRSFPTIPKRTAQRSRLRGAWQAVWAADNVIRTRLHSAGWSLGEMCHGNRWLVTGTIGAIVGPVKP
jgi:hypothetical protein